MNTTNRTAIHYEDKTMSEVHMEEGYVNIMREAAQSVLNAAVEAEEYNLVKTLGLVPFKDGNMWCVLWGKDLHVGICAFGHSPWDAIISFNKEMHKGENPKDQS